MTRAPIFLACGAWGGAHPTGVGWVRKKREAGSIASRFGTFLKPRYLDSRLISTAVSEVRWIARISY